MNGRQDAELIEDGQQDDVDSPLTPVVDLHGEPHPAVADRSEEHAFGSALDDHGAGGDLHDHGAQPARPDDELRARRHRRTDAARGFGPSRRQTRGRDQPRHAEREPDQRDPVHRDSASLESAGSRVEIGPGHLRDDLRDTTLDGVLRANVPLERLVHMERGGKEARVLARRVVVKRRERLPFPAQLFGGRRAEGRLSAAFEVLHTEPQPSEPGGDRVHVERFAAVRAGGQRDLGRAEREMVGGPGLDERNGLERLDRRARVDRGLDVPPTPRYRAVDTDDRRRPPVSTFHHVTPNDFDENGIGSHCGRYARARAKSWLS